MRKVQNPKVEYINKIPKCRYCGAKEKSGWDLNKINSLDKDFWVCDDCI